MPGCGKRGREQGRGQLGQMTKGGPGPEARGQVAGGAKANREAIELLFMLQSPLDSLRRKPLFRMVVKSTDFGVLKTLVTFLCFLSLLHSPGRCGFKRSNACLPVMSDGLPPVPRHQAPGTGHLYLGIFACLQGTLCAPVPFHFLLGPLGTSCFDFPCRLCHHANLGLTAVLFVLW